MVEHITKGKPLLICSDRALLKEESGGAWVIAGENGEIFATGSNFNTAYSELQTLYRSEIQAEISAILYTIRRCSFLGITPPKTVYYCDNEAFIKKIKVKDTQLDKAKDRDLLEMIYKITPKRLEPHHVYGHQDQVGKQLTTQEYLNVIADQIATHNKSKPVQIHPSHENSLYVDNNYIP